MYLVVVWFNLPAELMGRLGLGGYMLGFATVTVLFTVPMLFGGVALLYDAKSQVMTRREFTLLLAFFAVLASGASMWARHMIDYGAGVQTKTNQLYRKANIESFVNKMHLDGQEREAVLSQVSTMPDSSLCALRVLPLSQCQSDGSLRMTVQGIPVE